ncbi:MAG: 30S ribosome-binding factor RbfA [Clostridia bacterium]
MKVGRIEKVNSEIARVLSDAIQTRLNDPTFSHLISVNSVKTTADFRYAKIRIGFLDSKEKNKEEIISKLKKASGFFKKEIAENLKMRAIPELIFEIDDSIENSLRIEEILKTLIIPKEDDKDDMHENTEGID